MNCTYINKCCFCILEIIGLIRFWRRYVDIPLVPNATHARRPTGADRDARTWGTNWLTDVVLELLHLEDGERMYTAEDQLRRFQCHVPTFKQENVYELGYVYMYDTPENEIIQAWNASVSARSPDPIHELYRASQAGVNAYARSRGNLPFHMIPSRLSATAWLAKAQKVPNLFPDVQSLVYRYDDGHAAAGRMLHGRAPGAIPRPNIVQQVHAPPRHRRRVNAAGRAVDTN